MSHPSCAPSPRRWPAAAADPYPPHRSPPPSAGLGSLPDTTLLRSLGNRANITTQTVAWSASQMALLRNVFPVFSGQPIPDPDRRPAWVSGVVIAAFADSRWRPAGVIC